MSLLVSLQEIPADHLATLFIPKPQTKRLEAETKSHWLDVEDGILFMAFGQFVIGNLRA